MVTLLWAKMITPCPARCRNQLIQSSDRLVAYWVESSDEAAEDVVVGDKANAFRPVAGWQGGLKR